MTQPSWQPTLVGERIHLRPIRPDDFDGLFKAASDPLIWEQHSEKDRYRKDVFERFFKGALECGGGLLALSPSGQIMGSSRYYEWNPQESSVVVGYTFLARQYWGSGINAEMKRLMLSHAFQWARTVWFHVSPQNVRSQRALEKIGAHLDRSQDLSVGGKMSPRLLFKMERN